MSRRYGGFAMSELVELLRPDIAAALVQLEEDWMDARDMVDRLGGESA